MNAEQLRVNARVEDEHWWFVGRRRIMQALVAQIVLPDPQAIIIDVGCGTGANIGALARQYRAIGIDTSPAAIELAQQRFPDVEFLLGVAPDRLGTLAQEARLFLLMDVLEHVPDDFELFSRLVEVAAPGAYFLITVPASPEMWTEHDESHLHYRRYDLARLERVWQGLPLDVHLCSYFNARLFRAIQTIRAVNRLRGKASGEAGTDLWVPARPVNRLLESVFASEAASLVRRLGRGGRAFSSGVSLIAILQRTAGRSSARTRPHDVPADRHDPAVRRITAAAV